MSKGNFIPYIYQEINISYTGHNTSIYWSAAGTEKIGSS